MDETDYPQSGHGWSSGFRRFSETPAPYIRQSLVGFLLQASPEQVHAWDESIPPLQREVTELLSQHPSAPDYSAILEYQLPMEHRRPDVVLLMGGGVLVIEIKGKGQIDLADVDQASGYARDLRAYHRECAGRLVLPALVLMRATGRIGRTAGVEILGPDAIDHLAGDLEAGAHADPISRADFLDPEAYRPLPTIVEAARALLETGELPRVKRPDVKTRPTLDYLIAVAREAAETKSRHLVLLTGLPGTGKTLVGLQLAHSRLLDDLAVERKDGKPTAPAVYLSGNGPLVQVLQYELRSAGGGGAAFVRPIKAYVQRYSSSRGLVPPEHVLIFDEAQRAFDAAAVAATHAGLADGKSEPEHFIEFAERVPEWCVVVGLIGSGQEIHVGEEAGVGQWADAVMASADSSSWTVHVPPGLAGAVAELPDVRQTAVLHLSAELRYHLAEDVHRHVRGLLDEGADRPLKEVAADLENAGYHLRITRELQAAKAYLWARYQDDPQSRFGMIASSRDSDLWQFGVPNDFQSTRRVQHGPWFGEGDDDPRGRSCRTLRTCVTEFGCQGLELDATLLAWGTDFAREGGRWTNRLARHYQKPAAIRDALQLRRNAYRVLLTRARDATVVFVPPIPVLNETFSYLLEAGFRDLEMDQAL